MSDSPERRFRVFYSLCESLVSGVTRVYHAQIVANTVTIAVLHANVINPPKDPKIADYILNCGLTKVSRPEFEGFRYVTNASYLVYATAIFDSFITDVTKFLIYCNPSAVKDGITAGFDDVFGATSLGELKDKLISKKVRRLSYQSFEDRLTFLRRTFGLKVAIDESSLSTLRDISSIRNALAHDQSFMDLKFDENGRMVTHKKSCPRHPVNVSDQLFGEAWRLYISLCKKIYRDVVDKVIAYEDPCASERLATLLNENIFDQKRCASRKEAGLGEEEASTQLQSIAQQDQDA